jgi:TRAP transporter TAXI family solute receptor
MRDSLAGGEEHEGRTVQMNQEGSMHIIGKCCVVASVGILGLAAIGQCARAAEKLGPKLRICTGGEQGNYYWAGNHIDVQAKGALKIEVVSTKGSMENLEKIASGDCDGGIVQSDAFVVYQKNNPTAEMKLERSGVLYPELVHLMCNKKAGISKISKLTVKHTVAIGPIGSGSAVTWQGFRLADPERYGKVRTVPLSGERALAKVADGTDVQCMMFTAGLKTQFVSEIAGAYADRVELVPTDDRDMKDIKDNGAQRYEYSEIPSRMYKLNDCMRCGVDTIAVQALLVVNTAWVDENEKQYNKLLEAVRAALPGIRVKVGMQ